MAGAERRRETLSDVLDPALSWMIHGMDFGRIAPRSSKHEFPKLRSVARDSRGSWEEMALSLLSTSRELPICSNV